jgi:hypothetical protein
MALPVQTNTTCDVYHAPNVPPAAPDVTGLACFLRPAFREGQEAGEYGSSGHFTHVMSVAADADLRDGNENASGGAYLAGGDCDLVCVPDRNGTRFQVLFVERVARGTALDHKRAYLCRSTLTWPSNDV